MKEEKNTGYEKIRIAEGIHLMLIPKDNYKSNVITVYIKRPLIREEATRNSLLPSVMRSATASWGSPAAIAKKLQSLYGTTTGVLAGKLGERHILSFRMTSAADRYLPQPVFREALGVMKEILTAPAVKEEGFLPEYLQIEKEILKEDILSKINDKGRYAVERCIEIMCENEPYGISGDGYIEDLDQITPRSLYEYYREVIRSSPIDIVVAGAFEREEVLQCIREIFSFERGNLIRIPAEDPNVAFESKKVEEAMDVTQGKLILAFRTGVDLLHEDYDAMLLANAVLGGGAHSKLFLNVREKHSLCYSIYSSMEKFKGLLMINAGIEIEDREKAKSLILEQLRDLQEGRISEEEIRNARQYMRNGLMSLKDSLYSLGDFYYNQSLRDKNITLEEMAENIASVSKEDILRAASKIRPDTEYFLTAKK
ncbi:MAG: pitrilysin family protein [Peptostreptococcaceae bacterium]|nr:pitrilysin family protein [Peptostreptococcaceae bacterium]